MERAYRCVVDDDDDDDDDDEGHHGARVPMRRRHGLDAACMKVTGPAAALLRGILGRLVEQNLLKKTKRVDDKTACLLRLISSEEHDVSMHLLGKVLQRLRSLADPAVPTTIYVCLRQLPAGMRQRK
jgi:hypothetical protein